MTGPTKIATMLYDGDCAFCKHWVEKWRNQTGNVVRYAPYQSELTNFPQLSEAACKQAVQLILPDGTVFSGAKAVFKALALNGKTEWLNIYEKIPFLGGLFEWSYQIVAHNRTTFSKLTQSPSCDLKTPNAPDDKDGSSESK